MKIFKAPYIRILFLLLVLLVVAGEFLVAYYSQKLKADASNNISKDWLGRPSLLNNDDVWILVFRQAQRHGLDPRSTLHIRFSQDEGITWTSKDTFLDGLPVRGFPIVAHHSFDTNFDVSEGTLVKTQHGNLLLFVREEGPPQNGTYVWRSNDRGASWKDEGRINDDNTLLMGGQAVPVEADLYATFWVDENADYEPPFKTVLYKSPDYGKSWIHISNVTLSGTVESALAYLGGNEFLVILTDDAAGEKTYMRKSGDLGKSWGELQEVTDYSKSPVK